VNIEPRADRRNPGWGTADRSAPDIRVNSDLVLIPVMVTDRQDRLITGLERDHFRLWDEKTEQIISHFASEDVPVSVGLVFDCSGSMTSKLAESRAAVAEFLRSANPEDEFSLVTFNDRAELAVPFTSEIGEIQNRMIFITSRGRTALLDGIMLSMNEMGRAKHRRKAILIISDGGDNHSRYSTREVKERLRESDIQVYSIGIAGSPSVQFRTMEEQDGPALLDDIAKQTGGRLFQVNDIAELKGIAVKISNALRNQYVLGYVPTAGMRDGKYHRVRVRIAQPKGEPSFRTSFRSGYLAPAN